MISPELHTKIRALFFAEHWRVGTVATQLGVHPDTVKHAIETDRFVSKGRAVPSQLDPYLDFIAETLQKYPRLVATRVHEMVVQRGFGGSVIQTRRACRRLRPARPSEAFLRLSTLPGEQGQVDWGHFGHIQVGSARRPLYAFVMVLSWSRGMSVLFTLDQTTDSFLRGHVEAFEYFGGIPRILLYDNLKSVVLDRMGDAIHFNPRILEMCAHYHCMPRPVAVAKGNQKGRVERLIRFLRDRFFAARTFLDVDDLNNQFQQWRQEWAHERPCPQDDSMTVAQALDQERKRLLPLPEERLCSDTVRAVASGKTPYIRFDLNDYSIPHTLVRKPLTLVASADCIRILDGGVEVASHRRSYDRKRVIEDERHTEGLVSKKARARTGKGKERLCATVPRAAEILTEAVRRCDNLGAATAYLLRLLNDYGSQSLTAAIDEALLRGTPTPASVALICDQTQRRKAVPPPIEATLPNNPKVRDLCIHSHNLEAYDDLAH